MAIREGRWDCPSCGTLGQLGRQVSCTQCGNPRPEGVRFYLPGDAPEVDAGQAAQARAGADWVCEHCGASARATQPDCPGCGAPRGSSGTQQVRDYALDEVPRSGAPLAAAALPPKPQPKPRRRFPKLLVGLAGLVGVGVWANQPKDVTATVAEKAWERTVQVEEYRTVREEDWQLPSGGRLVDSRRDIREYRRVLDHYETRTRQVSEQVQVGTRQYTCGQRDMGNGYFEDITCTEPEYETRYRTETYEDPVYRQEPVYATKYRYDIEKWVPDSVARAAGGAGDPDWPALRLGRNEREGQKTEKYVLTFKDDEGRTYTTEVPLAQFAEWEVGEPAQLKVKRTGGRVQIVGGAEAPAAGASP